MSKQTPAPPAPPPPPAPDPIPPGRWTFTVEAAGIGPPMTVRVRRALKWLLRTHGLRAVDVREGDR